MTAPAWETLPRLMTARQAAQVAGVTESTFRRWLDDTPDLAAKIAFRARTPGGRQGSLRIKREPFRRWLDGEPLPEASPGRPTSRNRASEAGHLDKLARVLHREPG